MELVSYLQQVCCISVCCLTLRLMPCRNSTEKHHAAWYMQPSTTPCTAHARSAPTKAARISGRLPGWFPGTNQCGISWNICSLSCHGEKVHGKNRATPEFYVLCLCCELCFGCFGCLTVFSLNILYSFSAEAELWNVSADVDLLPIAVLTSCP